MTNRRRGFTLLELCVVVAVVVILLALLVPSLSRSRELTRRAQCVSNLRQLYFTMSAYATTFNGRVPTGYNAGTKQNSYFVYSAYEHVNQQNKFVMFGQLYLAGMADSPKLYYCPSAQLPQEGYNQVDPAYGLNPWPTGKSYNSGQSTRAGYSCRPTDPLTNADLDWRVGINNNFPFNTTTGKSVPLAKLDDFGNKAFLTDRLSEPVTVDTFHVDAVNTLYGDGAAKIVPRTIIAKQLAMFSTSYGTGSNNAVVDGMFAALDQYH